MDNEELRAWLRLIRLWKIPLRIKLELLGISGGSDTGVPRRPQEIFGLSDPELRPYLPNEATLQALRSQVNIDADLRWLEAREATLLTYFDGRYPSILREIPDPPLALYVSGNIGALHGPTLAVVGSRRPTPGGIAATKNLVGGLCRAGICIVSGLAIGIDRQAHTSAMEFGAQTIAVMATGPDQIYPDRHAALAGDIVSAGGALLSEFPVGTRPRRENFPRRNRIISGTCLGVLVVEAAQRSGSLITARLAAEQNREVFAAPGSILSPVARGSNDLIYAGAAMARSADDILAELEPRLRSYITCEPGPEKTEMKHVENDPEPLLQLIGFEPIDVDQVIQTSGLTAGQVSSMLLRLEIGGWLARCADGTVVRIL